MKWKNINNTSDRRVPSGYNSWLDFYEQKSGKSAKVCKVKDCTSSAADGAHVKKVNSSDNSWYIVPLCRSHNHDGDEFELNSDADPVRIR